MFCNYKIRDCHRHIDTKMRIQSEIVTEKCHLILFFNIFSTRNKVLEILMLQKTKRLRRFGNVKIPRCSVQRAHLTDIQGNIHCL